MTTNTRVTDYGRWVVNHPWWVILITVLLVMAAASGGRLLSFSTNYRVFFSEDNPQLVAFEALENTYTKNDNVMFILAPKDGNVFTPNALKAVQTLTQQAWQIPHSIRVDSITNFQHTQAEGDDLIVQDLVPEDDSLVADRLREIRNTAMNEPLLINRLISNKGHVAGINVTIQLPGINPAMETPETVTFARQLADKLHSSYPDIEVRISGMIMMNNAFSESSKSDMQHLVPISFLLMLVTLALLIKGFTGTFGTLLVIMFSIMTAMGLGGYIGYPITPPSASTPTIILTIAIANSVHVLVTFLHEMRRGREKRDAMVESLRINMQPVFLASVTTALGFLSMNFSDVPPFAHLGNMVAMGVLTSFVLAMAFLPALMSILPVRVKVIEKTDGKTLMEKLGDFVVRRRRTLIWGMTIVIVMLVASLPRNELNDVFVHYFDESVPFRVDSDFMTENLSGLYVIDYSLVAGETGGVSDPAFLKEVAAFTDWYRAQPETIHVNSITDIMSRLNKNMHGDDINWYRQPQERNLAAQYLLLYEMSLPYGLDLNNQLNIDKTSTRFTATVETMSSNELIALEQRAQEWLSENTSYIKQSHGSGPSIMFANIGLRNIKSMLIGTTVALIMISLILIIALRSIKIGLISMIPNLVPAAMGFGLWGLLVGEVGLGLSIVASMTLGIVVDDTVHFLSKYLRARREKGLNAEDAVRYAFSSVGFALLTTSIVLVVGFLVLALSSFYLNAGMGMLTAIVIAFALAADFLFLPPLLIKLEEKRNAKMDATGSTDTAIA
jgi:hypothetical protein